MKRNRTCSALATCIALFCVAVLNLICATSSVLAADPPSADRMLWLSADNGLLDDGSGIVTGWNDAGGVAGNWVDGVRGAPQKSSFVFPTGTHDVVRFTGADGLTLLNDAALRLNPISIYTVASIDAGSQGSIIIGNYRDVNGFGLGMSDSTSQRVKWFTAPPGDFLDDGHPDSGLTAERGYLISATYDAATDNKALYVRNNLTSSSVIGTGTMQSAAAYAPDTQLTVGNLDFGRQFFRGDIAEILVYSSVSATQQAAVEEYLFNKYFSVPPPPVGTIYRAGPDFKANEVLNGSESNPNGAWTYGTKSPSGDFTPYDFDSHHTDNWNGNPNLPGYSELDQFLTSLVVVNTADAAVSPCCGFTIDPSKIFMHPGMANPNSAVVRWTAPEAGTAFVDAEWIQKGGKAGILDVFVNGTSVFNGLGSAVFNGSILVGANDTIDFVVGPDFDGDPSDPAGSRSTQFDATVNFVATVPEPSTLVLGITAFLAAIPLLKRRA